jgi:sigma-E factor negative regulatory protein RseC
MRNVGHVVNLAGEVAEIVLGEHEECKGCGMCVAVLGNKQRKVKAANGIGARIGQKVEIEIEPKDAISAAFIVFIFPLLMALVGGVLGHRVASYLGLAPAVGGIALGVCLFVVSFLVLRLMERRSASETLPKIIRIVSDEEHGGRC